MSRTVSVRIIALACVFFALAALDAYYIYTLSHAPTPAPCGNGHLDEEEECDDGERNGKEGSDCTYFCQRKELKQKTPRR